MRYFIGALDTINLGIPAEQTERIIPVSRIQTSVYATAAQSDVEGACISLPALLRQKDMTAPHGLVLKSVQPLTGGKTILLMPKIDRDIEIPEDAIHRLPETFAGVFSFFIGAYFESDQNLILIVDPRKLTEVYHD